MFSGNFFLLKESEITLKLSINLKGLPLFGY